MIPSRKARSPVMRPRRSCGVLAEARQEIWHQNIMYIMSENDKTLLYSRGMNESVRRFDTGALEGVLAVDDGWTQTMSQQQLADCDTIDSARNGGLMDNGFDFAEKNAMCTEASYSYNATKGACQASSRVIGFVEVSRDTRTCSPTARRL